MRTADVRTVHLPMKILAFFIRNDDEELSIQDVCDKFGVNYQSAQRALLRLNNNDWLDRREVGNVSLYSIKPEALKDL